MPRRKKTGKRIKKTLWRLACAPVFAVSDVAVHLKDGFFQIFVHAGLIDPPEQKNWRGKSSRRPVSQRETHLALNELKKAESKRNQKELEIKLRERRLLKSKSEEGKKFHKDLERSVRSVSKGQSVSHLFKMQQKAKQDATVKATEKAQSE
jgi:hypothetical protein